MLNPSTADASNDDPTIRRCLGFCRQIGDFGRLEVVNLFAFRTPSPSELQKETDPYGQENEAYQTEAIKKADLIICAWGTNGAFLSAGDEIIKKLSPFSHKTFALDLTKNGHPKHPLYVAYDLQLKTYSEMRESRLPLNIKARSSN